MAYFAAGCQPFLVSRRCRSPFPLFCRVVAEAEAAGMLHSAGSTANVYRRPVPVANKVHPSRRERAARLVLITIRNRFWPSGVLTRSLKPKACVCNGHRMRGPGSQTRAFSGCGPQFSIADPQQVLPLPKVALEAHALGDLEEVEIRHRSICLRFCRSDRRLTGIPGVTVKGERRIAGAPGWPLQILVPEGSFHQFIRR